MNRRMWLALFVAVLLAVALPLLDSRAAVLARSPAPRPSVYIVAVQNARLLTMCPQIPEVTFEGARGVWKPNGQARVLRTPFGGDVQRVWVPTPRPSIQGDRRRDIEEDPARWGQFISTTVLLPRGTARMADRESVLERVRSDPTILDQGVEQALRREFVRLERYRIVNSADTADYVLLADSWYEAPTMLRQSVLAIMVPGAAYRRTPTDITALLNARVWEGSALLVPPYRYEGSRSEGINAVVETPYLHEKKTYTPAPPESVVRQLHGKEPRNPSHPVLCAAQ